MFTQERKIMNHVTELVLFRLKDDVNEAEFLQDAQATFDLLKSYEGYIHRELSVTEDGLWLDVVTWKDMQSAMTASEDFMTNPVGKKFEVHIHPESVQMNHAILKIRAKTA
jgi:hypothetical protein